jgi:2-aminobenzoate-CoA ligase
VLRAIEAAKLTVVFAGPTIYGAIVAIPCAPDAFPLSSVRLFVSAGDVLTASLFEALVTNFGRHILDGLGSTECLHIFMSSTPTDATAGELGTVIAPYETRLVNERIRY